jgi:hypothetical protein
MKSEFFIISKFIKAMCMHACLFERDRESGREMHIGEPGGGWFLWVSGFCILENEKVSFVKVANWLHLYQGMCWIILSYWSLAVNIYIHHGLTPYISIIYGLINKKYIICIVIEYPLSHFLLFVSMLFLKLPSFRFQHKKSHFFT